MSDLSQPLVIALQEKKGSRKMTTVQPLKAEPVSEALTLDAARAMLEATEDMAALEKTWKRRDMAPFRDELAETLAFRKTQLAPVIAADAEQGFVA